MKSRIFNLKPFKILTLFAFLFFLLYTNICFSATNKQDENLNLYCNNNLLMDANSGNVLFEKNGYSKIYPASTTKILTTILVLDNLALDENVVVSQKAANSVPIGSSVMGVKAGEIYSVENLLYGLLLPSGNDAAIVLAEAVSSNVDDFAKLMNDKAKQIGCLNTHFVNPHGFFDENHYSTPYDMALIFKYAMKYDKFREILGTKTWELPPTNKTPEKRTLKNTNRLIDDNYSVFYKYALGGKTGYTIESRGTYVGYAKKDDKLLIVSNFDGSQNINGQNARFLDAISLSNYGFNNFNNEKIIDKSLYSFEVLDERNNKKITLALEDDIYSLISENDYIIAVPSLKLNFDDMTNNTSKISLHIYGKNIDINNEYNALTTKTNNYITIKYILKFVPYTILFILIIILIYLICILIKNRKNDIMNIMFRK